MCGIVGELRSDGASPDLEGPYVELIRDALCSSAARQRGLFNPRHVNHLLANPNEHTTLRYNKLWELGLLELWLQTHGI